MVWCGVVRLNVRGSTLTVGRNRSDRRSSSTVTCHASRVMYHVSCVKCHVSRVMCHVSRVTCHVSCVMCHVSRVTCHVSRVMCHVSCDVSCAMCHVSRHVSCVKCHVSFVLCHVMCDVSRVTSRVMCHVSCVTCHVSCEELPQIVGIPFRFVTIIRETINIYSYPNQAVSKGMGMRGEWSKDPTVRQATNEHPLLPWKGGIFRSAGHIRVVASNTKRLRFLGT